MGNSRLVVCISFAVCLFIVLVQELTSFSYLVDTVIKVSLFFGGYLLFVSLTKKYHIPYKKISKSAFLWSVKWGYVFAVVIFLTYFILEKFVDTSAILLDLQKSEITPGTLVLVGLYIIFGNSFLEEFFFRGFVFLNIANKWLAHVYSAVLFAVYHLAVFNTWFTSWTLYLALFGLVAVGVLFNWMNQKYDSMLPSWIAHIVADIAIMIIALKVWGIV